MSAAHVTSVAVSTAIRPTFGPATGCDRLEQSVVSFPPGGRTTRSTGADEEVLYVLQGSGVLRCGDQEHALEADAGASLAPGSDYTIESVGVQRLELVSVRLPAPAPGDAPDVTVRTRDEQESGKATADRAFRLVSGPETGCHSATQFVGIIPPGRAPDHYHHYDEVLYVLEGTGVLHLADSATPVAAGSCIHLPARLQHSLENAGLGPLEVVGVFRPAGSPSEAYYPDGTPALNPNEGQTR